MQEQGKFYVTYIFLLSSSLQTSLKAYSRDAFIRDNQETRKRQDKTRLRLVKDYRYMERMA